MRPRAAPKTICRCSKPASASSRPFRQSSTVSSRQSKPPPSPPMAIGVVQRCAWTGYRGQTGRLFTRSGRHCSNGLGSSRQNRPPDPAGAAREAAEARAIIGRACAAEGEGALAGATGQGQGTRTRRRNPGGKTMPRRKAKCCVAVSEYPSRCICIQKDPNRSLKDYVQNWQTWESKVVVRHHVVTVIWSCARTPIRLSSNIVHSTFQAALRPSRTESFAPCYGITGRLTRRLPPDPNRPRTPASAQRSPRQNTWRPRAEGSPGALCGPLDRAARA